MIDNLYKKLSGKKILVTGGNRGIGRAIAIAFANAGADVLISYNKNEHEAIETITTMHKFNRYANCIKVDLSNRIETQTLIEEAVKELGHIDVLVNNAGILTRQTFLDVSDKDLERVIEINLIAPFILTQNIAKEMIKKGIKGSIINIGSISSEKASRSLSHYECAKAGLLMMTKSAALALGNYGIRVNAIQPGLTETDMNFDIREKDELKWQEKISSIPLGRVGIPEDHVGAALFLASDDSSWVTGASIIIDGGRSVYFT
jgi:NAD(P)-dependent dehydrogenase (short-subunit alcohol dehydrogenase family)